MSVVGYEAQEFFQNTSLWLDNIHPDDVERVLAGLTGLFEHGYHVHEYRFWNRLNLILIAEDFPKLLESMQEGAERITQIVLSLRSPTKGRLDNE